MTRADARGTLRDGWRLSVGTITAIPVRPPTRIDRRVAGTAMVLAPLAVLPIAVLWLVGGLASVFAPAPSLIAALVITGMVLATRAMHLDGLADTADGLSASYDRDRALEVMKTGDVGPSGAAAIALTLLIQVVATATLFGGVEPARLALGVVAVCTSRLSLALACRRGIPAARPGGLGATVAGSVPPGVAVAATFALVVVGSAAVALLGGPSWAAPVVILAGGVSTWLLVRRCVRRLGGITGDVLGAGVEISCATALGAAALVVAAIG